MIFACHPSNDLYRALCDLGHTFERHEALPNALAAATPGSGVLALADDYPRLSQGLDQELHELVLAKDLRLYLEYPSSLLQWRIQDPRPTQWERLVVTSDFFAPELPPRAILAQHGCWFLTLETKEGSASQPSKGEIPSTWQPGQGDSKDPLAQQSEQPSSTAELPHSYPGLPASTEVVLAVARVAGYDRAVYGLPDEAHPILFHLTDGPIWVAMTKLSGFVNGRYGPRRAWAAIWQHLLEWIEPTADLPPLTWTPTVQVQAQPDVALPRNAEQDALDRSARWFRDHVVYSIDWKKGAIEGFESAIDHQGRQLPRPWARGDCTAETGMVFAFDWVWKADPASRRRATQVLDYVWSAPDFNQDDPGSLAYGLNNWYERGPVFYGDDNARVILSTLAARHLLQEPRWDERVLRCLLANLRTTGQLGFRRNRIDLHQFYEQDRGWEFFCREGTVSYAPHYQAYLWAAYLIAYALTSYDEFLVKASTAIRMTMDAYPAWQWTNGITQELARMILPLAFLVRIEDTTQHREWLDHIASELLAQMQPCGAIRERLGPLQRGRYPPPQSNAAYGTTEAPLIQADGDPACDLLYTANYAFLGLHEAALATGERPYREATDRLTDFLCRIQVRSQAHPYLDGAWMRGFDYERWEYWGSSADAGWGAWSVESGWTNTWIAAVLAMRQIGRSLFDLATGQPFTQSLPKLLDEMLGQR